MQIRILSDADVRAAVDMPTAIAAVSDAFAALSGGDADVPLRHALTSPHGVHLFMPAFVPPGALATKVVSVNPGNAERGLPAIHAAVLVMDPVTGRPTGLMNGTWLTALRTGAAGGLAADLLARPEASVVALFGAGVQARTQLDAVRCVRDVTEVRVVAASLASARAFADTVEGIAEVRPMEDGDAAVEGADLVITATTSPRPVFDGRRVGPGSHVTAVGSYRPDMREVDGALVASARLFVDDRQAVLEEAGEITLAIADGNVPADVGTTPLGEVAAGRRPGRIDPSDITLFKSVGNAVQDAAVAVLVMDTARQRGLGTVLEI